MEHGLAFAPAVEQAELLRKRTVSAVELTDLYLRRIEALNPKLDAYLTVVADQALAAARAADERIAGGGELPPFLGVTISIKDLTDTAGIRTTCGTAVWHDRVPDRDEEVVARIRRAGFTILGKTNTPEFGKSILTETPAYPPARNPWDPSRTPGGSSGGAAAATAAGLCAIAHGTDGGGSIRLPSSLCGVVGLKPSRFRVTNAPRPPDPYATHGPIARTVVDCAALLDVIAGPAPGDSVWPAPPSPSFASLAAREPGRLHIGFTTAPITTGVEPEPSHVAATEETAKLLSSLGHDVEAVDLPWDITLMERCIALFASETLVDSEHYPDKETLDMPSRLLVELGASATGSAYVGIAREIARATRAIHELLASYDAILTPTVPCPPLPVGAFGDDGEVNIEAIMRSRALAAYTPIANLTGLPAMSLPLLVDGDGLPIGMHFVGRPADETTLLQLGTQLEAARPWSGRRPPLADLR